MASSPDNTTVVAARCVTSAVAGSKPRSVRTARTASNSRGSASTSTEPSPFGTTSSDRKSTRLNSSHGYISHAVFCLKKKKQHVEHRTSLPPPIHPPQAPHLVHHPNDYVHPKPLSAAHRIVPVENVDNSVPMPPTQHS